MAPLENSSTILIDLGKWMHEIHGMELNETGRPLKVLRMDHGKEFNSLEFSNFCETNGIQRQLTAAYTPQQNGVCDRKIRAILNKVRSILSR